MNCFLFLLCFCHEINKKNRFINNLQAAEMLRPEFFL